jgi:two-component system, NtrC family, response regulator HydG
LLFHPGSVLSPAMARILVVDDTAQNLALIELYLRGTEFEVATADSGHEALERCREQSYDLILLDVVMPVIDGFEVCRRLKNDPATAFIPVIFLTGRLGDESEKLAAYQLGAVDYIQKPVNREELVARIRVMLRLEDTRSRIDRENVALRRQLGKLLESQGDVAESLRELQLLRQEFANGQDPALLIVDAQGRVVSGDGVVVELLGELAPGDPLATRGPGPARLWRLIEDRVRTADLPVTDRQGRARSLQVRVRGLPGGSWLVVLQDLTGARAVEQRLRDRELLPSTEPVVGWAPPEAAYRMTDFIGRTPAIDELSSTIGMLRQTRSTVLIYGASGTGKELVARALHFDGQFRAAPFIPLHCGAIAPELIESELFGHEKGAFTGAQQSRDGLFRAADGGTIFLDEIAETSPAVQVKLLRVLQRGEIRPVGASQPRIVDVRIIAATNRDLLQLVREGKFREDLYYRLEVVTVHLAPLRERLADLPLLVEHFLARCNRRFERLDRPVRGVSRGAMECMMAYPWPGNVRELENVIERAFALGVSDVLQQENLPPHVRAGLPTLDSRPVTRPVVDADGPVVMPAVEPSFGGDLRARRDALDRKAMLDALRASGDDKASAARALGMSRSTFYRRLKELGM